MSINLQHTIPLLDRLPPVRGRLTAKAPLAQMTWFQVGGAAEVLFKPADEQDLADFLANCPADIPVFTIGVASNLLIRDGGIWGVVIRLGRGFTDITTSGTTITAGAAALDVNVARVAQEAGLAGLEFLSGIPGTIGGALRMNAGAYGREVKDCLIKAHALDRQGKRHTLSLADMQLTYRHSGVPKDWIFVGAEFAATPDGAGAIAARMVEIQKKREESQPIRAKTGGSTFANPEGHKAWQLIDSVGGRGLAMGGAQISEKHCNFLINTGNATAADLENLGEEMRRRVRAQHGVELRWEIARVGLPKET